MDYMHTYRLEASNTKTSLLSLMNEIISWQKWQRGRYTNTHTLAANKCMSICWYVTTNAVTQCEFDAFVLYR